MGVKASGQLSMSTNIGAAAGFPTSVQKSLNQGKIRALTGTAANTQNSMSSYYGVPSAARYWRWYITSRRGSDAAGIQASILQPMSPSATVMPTTYSNPSGSTPANEGISKLFDNNQNTKFLDFNFGGSVTNVNNGFTDVRFSYGSPQQLSRYRWWTANDAVNRDPTGWTLQCSYNNSDWVTQHTITNYTPTTLRNYLAYDTGMNQIFTNQ